MCMHNGCIGQKVVSFEKTEHICYIECSKQRTFNSKHLQGVITSSLILQKYCPAVSRHTLTACIANNKSCKSWATCDADHLCQYVEMPKSL